MDVGGSDEESSLFQAFTMPSVGIENRNVNKTNDPISNVPKPLSTHQRDCDRSWSQEKVQFEEFTQLPAGLKTCISNDLIGTPLEEIDPFYHDKKTFIVINSNKNLFRFSSLNALWLFSPINIFRHTAIRILTHPIWAVFMIGVIVANCAFILSTGNGISNGPWELIFLIVYLVEFLLKIVSRGFLLSSFSYLRDGWNWLDFILVIVAIISICLRPDEAIYSSPVLSELRILKIASISLSLRQTAQLYWNSLLALRDLLLYIIYILFIISVLCLQMYMGMLSQRCVKIPMSALNDEDWSTFTTTEANFFHEGDLLRACGNMSGAQDCPTNYMCLQGIANPNYGITNFDTIFRSFFTVFRLAMRDFWEEVMFYVLATAGTWHILLFVGLIYFCSFQLLSLIWGPIAVAYIFLKDAQWETELLKDLQETHTESATNKTTKTKNIGCCAKFQRSIFNLIYNPFAVLFVIVCILLNTLFMALDHHNMSVELEKILMLGNYFFVLVFVIEAVLKLTALGPVQYFKDEWNTFDFIVTALGVVELGLENVQGLSVLRSFRLLRPLRLGKIVPAFDLLMARVRHLFSRVANQALILCMFIYIFMVFGWREFGPQYIDNVHRFYGNTLPRWNFADIFHTFMIVFRSLCGEWIESLFDCMLVNDATSVIYFIALALIGSFAIIHLFVALLLTSDDSAALPTEEKEQQQSSHQLAEQSSNRPKKFNLHTYLKDKLLEPRIKKIFDENKPITDDIESSPVDTIHNAASTTIVIVQSDSNTQKNAKDDSPPVNINVVAPVASVDDYIDDEIDDDNIENATKIELTKWSGLRVKSSKFNQNKYFQYTVAACISIASLILAFTVSSFPLAHAGPLLFELAFCIVMIIEFISKIISCGWKSYFKNIWCLIDLFNTIVPIVGLFVGHQTISILKAVRPISLVSRCSGLKIIATTIGRQMQLFINTLVICAAFWLIFAIMGVQMFAGKFYHCVDQNQTRLDIDFVSDRQTCIAKNYTWTNSAANFDNVIQAYLSLTQVATFKGWILLINDAVDAREIDRQPASGTNVYMFLYFVIFIIFGVFMCLNLLIGILVKYTSRFGNLNELFSDAKEIAPDSASAVVGVNNQQQNEAEPSKWTQFSNGVYFEWIAFGLCVGFIVSLSFDHYRISAHMSNYLSYSIYITAMLFLIETGLRLHSLRNEFLKSFWNFFDAVTAILTVIEFFMVEFSARYFISVSLLRVVRVMRFNTLLSNSSKRLKLSLLSLRKSSMAAWNLCLFLFLIIFVYAIIGTIAFGRVTNIFPINENITFRTFGQSIILLIQLSTCAAWDRVYGMLSYDPNKNSFLIAFYLLSFMFLSFFVIINLILTIVLSWYCQASEENAKSNAINTTDLNDFFEKWQTIASVEEPKFIHKSKLSELLRRLVDTSSLRLTDLSEDKLKLLGIPVRKDNQLYQGEVLIALNKTRLRNQGVSNTKPSPSISAGVDNKKTDEN